MPKGLRRDDHGLSSSLANRLARLPRRTKRAIMVSADTVFIPLSLWFAHVLDASAWVPVTQQPVWPYLLTVILSAPIFARLGLYRAVVRFMGPRVVFAVLHGVTAVATVFGLVAYLTGGYPLTLIVIFWGVLLFYVGGSRFAVRSFLQRQRRSSTGERVAIYGAGGAGARLASALIGGQEFVPVAFIDDGATLQGSVINGLEVYSPDALPALVQDLEVSRVLLAMPSVPRRQRQRIIQRLEEVHVHIQTMPNFSDLISGNARVDEIRDVDVADLLGRETVPPHEALLDACVKDKVILVTGAGGSIGSELCRQISRLQPRKLILLDSSEIALYMIDRELGKILNRENLGFSVIPLLGSVSNRRRMTAIMESFGVQTVYHAAAYKHVPIVEQNMFEGVRNNIFGTLNTALSAVDAGVDTFVLVSTDKAVCPTNVMGATKRMAEIVLQGLDQSGTNTRFSMVRFGNVLESSGSVVPLFREQIRQGGPVTVTHPEIIRYFMTIPEAAQLVIQAGSLGYGGDVFVLNMGKPVKIEDLARRMVNLMGLTVLSEDNPDGDIEIKYTGLRPAEKLYEELLIGNNVTGTRHPMIMRAQEKKLPWSEVSLVLDQLQRAMEDGDYRSCRQTLERVVEEYAPASGLRDLVWQNEQAGDVAGARRLGDNVTPLNTKRGN